MNAPRKRQDFLDPARAAQAVMALRQSIAVLNEDDQLLADTIEGETGLFEVIDALLIRIVGDRVHLEGIDAVVADLEERKSRFKRRIEADRALIEQAMMIAALAKIERPVCSLFLSARTPKVEVMTEADIPARFWKTPDPELDKKALGHALKERQAAIEALGDIKDPDAKAVALARLEADHPDIPGAALSNAAPSLTTRWK